jgi:hypothetical protein
MTRLPHTNQARSSKKNPQVAPQHVPFRYTYVPQEKPQVKIDSDAPGRIWNVKSRNTAQVVLFIVGVVLFLMGFIR